ncbi:MAG: DUF424 family protein [Candidatus Anstonellales archaeon]
MLLKIHVVGGKKVVAVCDSELVGKKFVEGHISLDLERCRSFYDGEKISDTQRIVFAIKEAQSANLVGHRCVEVAKKAGLITDDDVFFISGVPHVILYNLSVIAKK